MTGTTRGTIPGPATFPSVTAESGGRLYQQIEIENGPFKRVVELGADVVAEEASASYVDGVLRVEIPLAAPDQSVRRVQISDS